MTATTRTQFGDFLRSRRKKLTPDAAGLNGGRRRRTPGLRREEVAELAGIGVDWYVRMEQGRVVSPSESTLDALAQALRLDKAEAAHLRALARRDEPREFVRESVPPTVERLIASLDHPAYVTGRRWDLLAWNAAAADLFGFDRLAEADRNILVYMFVEPEARRLFAESWSDEARRMIALFRVSHDLYAGDPAFVALVERLRANSGEFAQWWGTHDVRSGVSGQKVFVHAQHATQRYEYATFQSNDDPALKLAIYTRVSAEAAPPLTQIPSRHQSSDEPQ
ncbi:helix-turn-helix transcriptional regulator [Paraburkholderia fungorum]|uniref:helix-turn-helix transcriptional regulator n=1 Tax=Paraburkholderia fungorum TaxID=134537 RepID=UPI0020933896|nr:helix-turn-helix transcriptional regulator [Paraburkholderia fungorum]USU21403.1 helix-turn-helix transcriptional regulator [Paraburkholderia fungorum]USU26601.1 helix-turn-helix transcriptional regulator [Paraburkholderia fungorum]